MGNAQAAQSLRGRSSVMHAKVQLLMSCMAVPPITLPVQERGSVTCRKGDMAAYTSGACQIVRSSA